MSRYPDTSFLYAFYREQDNSEAADALMNASPVALPVSEVLLFEFRQSLRLQMFLRTRDRTKGFGAAEAGRMFTDLASDLRTGVVQVVAADLASVFTRAEAISARHTQTKGNRAFDILHVATARELGAGEFLSFDVSQRRLAAAEGLIVLPVVL